MYSSDHETNIFVHQLCPVLEDRVFMLIYLQSATTTNSLSKAQVSVCYILTDTVGLLASTIVL